MVYKRLKSYIDVLKELSIETHGICDRYEETVICHISYNSLDVKPGTLFICKGNAFKKEYLDIAIEKGALCYIAQNKLTDKIPGIVVKDVREALSLVSGHMYDHIWNEKLTEIGITGTKGKTTTTYFIKSILDCSKNSEKTAVVSGIYNFDGHRKEKADLTTPETLELHKIMSDCIENGCDTLVMEVSSQGLKYKRVEDIKYKIGVFMNIGMDHISGGEHESFEDYFHSKLEIFKQCEIACINADLEEKYLYEILDIAVANKCKIVTFGTREVAHYRGILINESATGIKFDMLYNGTKTTLETNIGGAHNMINALAAAAVCRELGICEKHIKEGLFRAKIPGRMEVFQVPNKDSKIIIDYAHNRMSYEALFETINKNYPGYKKLFMFGCASDKAYNRRKEAGEIAKKEADKVIITKYNSGKETFDEICEEICRYIDKPKCDIKCIENRDEAIASAINDAANGWIIILAGCENDSETVKKLLK